MISLQSKPMGLGKKPLQREVFFPDVFSSSPAQASAIPLIAQSTLTAARDCR
jgi:hypothetical protein